MHVGELYHWKPNRVPVHPKLGVPKARHVSFTAIQYFENHFSYFKG